MRIRFAVALAVVVLGLTACRQSELGFPASVPPPGTDDTVLTDPDAVADLAIADLEAFWADRLPEVYDVDYEPLEGGIHAFGPSDAVPVCGAEHLVYDDIAENALYCPADDYIAWDRVALLPAIQEQFGTVTTGVVLAHEFAHAVQARAGVEVQTVVLELQADCFAGAWLADASARLATFSTERGALDLAAAGLLELRDAIGVGGFEDEAHGSGFDRVGAFQEGYESGPGGCADYERQPPPVVAIPFNDARDQRLGGNLPLDQLLEPLVADLETFFGAHVRAGGGSWNPVDELVPIAPGDVVECNGDRIEGEALAFFSAYCADRDVVVMDGVGLVPTLTDIGDFAFGGELTRLYAIAARSRLGQPIETRDDALALDCLTGAFGSAEFEHTVDDQQLTLSPGDLDEVIIGYLTVDIGHQATAFDRIAAYRTGFTGGTAACDPPA